MGESNSLAIVWCHFFGQRALVKADALSLFERVLKGVRMIIRRVRLLLYLSICNAVIIGGL